MSGETTVDLIRRGELALEQPRRGYRFNVDALILADFAATVMPAPGLVVELGAGCGVVGLLLARRLPQVRVVLVELQSELAALAAANVQRNDLSDRVRVMEGDLRTVALWSDTAPDLVVSNPPFFRAGAGRTSAHPQVATARHEISCSLEQLASAAAAGLTSGGQLAIIHAMSRYEEVVKALGKRGLIVTRRREVRPLPERPANRVLVLAARDSPLAAQAEPPLIVEERPGRYTEDMADILEPRARPLDSGSRR
jgi:tRNA1Val (adenine37-N6)-methyltransferase